MVEMRKDPSDGKGPFTLVEMRKDPSDGKGPFTPTDLCASPPMVEMRKDPSDGKGPFTYASFLRFHGPFHGKRLWDQGADTSQWNPPRYPGGRKGSAAAPGRTLPGTTGQHDQWLGWPRTTGTGVGQV